MNDIQSALNQLRNSPPPSRAVLSPAQFKDLPPFQVFSQTVNSFVANQKIQGNFFGLKMPLSLNYPGTRFSVSLDGGEAVTVQTGDELLGPFGTCEVLSVSVDPQVPELSASPPISYIAGSESVGFVLYRRPDVFWIEVAQANSYPYSGPFIQTPPSALQAYNSANPPTALNGCDSSKAKSVKFFVQSEDGTGITGGTLRVWRHVGFGSWALTSIQITLPTGSEIVMTEDIQILTPGDLIYCEVYNGTTVGASGDFYAYTQFGY